MSRGSANERYMEHLKGGRNFASDYEMLNQQLIEDKLTNLCANRFEYHNLPEEVPSRAIELAIFYQGNSTFFMDERYGKFVCLPGSAVGSLDYKGDPKKMRMVSHDRKFGTVVKTIDECVPIFGNYTRTAELITVKVYARRLAKLDTTIEINTDNARMTRVIASSESTRLTMQNIDSQIQAGVPSIKVEDSLNLADKVYVLDTGIDYRTFESLGVARSRILNECMWNLGLNAANQEKKERLLEAEVAGNDEQIGAMKAVALETRQQAVEKINKMFNLKISVDYSKNITSKEDSNGEFHD